MSRSWTIGSLPDCDLVVTSPMVTGRHCRLTVDEQGQYSLEDLGSRNGTFVNGSRVAGKVRVGPTDAITLGPATRMPWPAESASSRSSFRVGRAPDNDYVINLATVSGYHARVVRGVRPGEAVIEDLDSANGTAVGSPDRKSARSTFRAGDTIYLGSHPVPAAELLARLDPSSAMAVTPSSGGYRGGPSAGSAGSTVRLRPGPSTIAGIPIPLIRWLALASQTPVVAIGVCVVAWLAYSWSRDPSKGVATALSWLGLAGIWFGLSAAVVGDVLDSGRPRGTPIDPALVGRRLGTMAAFGLGQCLFTWAFVAIATGLSSPWLPSIALLILSWVVGLSMGCLLDAMAPIRIVAWAGLAAAVLPLWVLGGGPQSIPRRAPWVKAATDVVPSRWAFEGLLLLELEGVKSRMAGDRGGRDLAEDYFPARTDRMGPRADVMALLAFLLATSAGSSLVIGTSAMGRGSPSGP